MTLNIGAASEIAPLSKSGAFSFSAACEATRRDRQTPRDNSGPMAHFLFLKQLVIAVS